LDVRFHHDADRFAPRGNAFVGAVAVAAIIIGVFWKAGLGADVVVILVDGAVSVLLAKCRRPAGANAARAGPLVACQ
jgi:hypothetical protein